MQEFRTTVTTVSNYVVSSDCISQMADDIEQIINDYIENNWDVYDAREVPLKIRKQFLLHIIEQMIKSDADYEHRATCPDSDFLWA